MEYDGMVHALEEIHRLLKPGGALIDIHPVSEPSSIEVHQAGRIDQVGQLSVRQWCFEFEQADIALAQSLQRGVFTLERKSLFDLPTYYSSAAELGPDLKESVGFFARDAEAAVEPLADIEALADRAAELMRAAGSGADLIVHERTHISRLKPA
jgi:hypothetical protein